VPQVEIRIADVSDDERIAALINPLAEKFILCDFAAAGRVRFLSDHTPAAIAERLRKGFRYRVAICEGELVGVVGVRDNAHLFHLFVAEAFQHRGLAHRLWEGIMVECLRAGNPGVFTVNSSRFAVPVYERFGFTGTGPEQNVGGVLFLPMRLDISARQVE